MLGFQDRKLPPLFPHCAGTMLAHSSLQWSILYPLSINFSRFSGWIVALHTSELTQGRACTPYLKALSSYSAKHTLEAPFVALRSLCIMLWIRSTSDRL